MSSDRPGKSSSGLEIQHFDDRPIGLFDSGIGGLSILCSLLKAFPNESFIYLGDTARLPYGSKSPDTISRYVKQNISFLDQLGVKCVIVACNTASTVLIGQDPSQFSVPVYNVIDPGAKRALSVSRNHRIGVIATNATVAAGSYAKSLKALKSDAVVFQRASPLLVALVEEGWDDDPITNLIIYRYVNPLLANDIDTLILGCTHYPVLRGGISRVVGSFVTLVDSSDAIIDCLHADIEADKFIPSRARHVFRVLATDISPVFATVAARLMAPLTLPTIELVDL